jgi:hypothetical protein
MLFGETSHYQSMVEKIVPGDLLFLYNNTTQELHGVFEAVSHGQKNILQEAWKGKFPWQVHVQWKKKFVHSLPREISQSVMHFWGKTKRHPQEYLTNNQIQALLTLFESHEKLPVYEDNFRKRYPARFLAEDGHWVRSYAELLIDNWFFHHHIPHAYERKLPTKSFACCDFFIPPGFLGDQGIYIEYWGNIDADYERRREEKIKIYEECHFPLVQLEHTDLTHLDDVLPMKLGLYSSKRIP